MIFGAFPPCGADIPLDAAISMAAVSHRTGDFVIARSKEDLTDVSIHIDKDSSFFKVQAK
jgi:hypothetical protein